MIRHITPLTRYLEWMGPSKHLCLHYYKSPTKSNPTKWQFNKMIYLATPWKVCKSQYVGQPYQLHLNSPSITLWWKMCSSQQEASPSHICKTISINFSVWIPSSMKQNCFTSLEKLLDAQTPNFKTIWHQCNIRLKTTEDDILCSKYHRRWHIM